MRVRYSSQFKKQYKKLPKKMRDQFKERLGLFLADRSNPQLRFHKLTGKYDGLWSIYVTGDIRAVIDMSYADAVLFVAIGSHSSLYS